MKDYIILAAVFTATLLIILGFKKWFTKKLPINLPKLPKKINNEDPKQGNNIE